jgi:hypothetical protein
VFSQINYLWEVLVVEILKGIHSLCYRPCYNINSKKIMQGVEYRYSEKSAGIKMIYIYDVESQSSLNTQPCFLLESFEGFSQINFNNNLYFCGGNEKTKGGTYFLMYDPSKLLSSMSHLINCLFDHKYPSMSVFKNEFIIIVGGMGKNVKSEIYSISKRKWKALPDLPEGRYGGGLLSDDKLDNIYLFGGMCGDTYCTSVLRLYMKNLIIWESLNVKENSHLLKRSHFALFKLNKHKVLILGGNSGDELSDSVVEFDLLTKTPFTRHIKLKKPSNFKLNHYVEMHRKLYYFFDSNSYIHEYNKESDSFRISDYKENSDNLTEI